MATRRSGRCGRKRRRISGTLWNRTALLILLNASVWPMGCSEESGRGVRPDSPGLSAKEREVVTAAKRAVAQFDNWADRAEFKLKRSGNVWHVTAWRVEHPNAKGNKRYAPWGSRAMVIDDSGQVIQYTNGR